MINRTVSLGGAVGQVIGMADYRDLDPYAGVATPGVTIGEREFWGRGHGSDALRLLVGHLFGAYSLSRLELDTWSGNERAVRAFTRLGFHEEGRRRSAGKRDNAARRGAGQPGPGGTSQR
ncbi:GNAT family N-acetyltransferase [Streptomyces sp. NPDC090036]|uniref:GNAT family N-acetyltransferase n=1 Tax=Streptomyces sp. NPDC090036 TaxID=3365926 RepID=UPI00382C0718